MPARICVEYYGRGGEDSPIYQTYIGYDVCPNPTTITTCGSGGLEFQDPPKLGDIEASVTTLSIDEGNTGTFTVKLDTEPSADATVTISSADAGAVSVDPASLTFTTSNYSTAQTVTVTGEDDADGSDETVDITLSASGGIKADDVEVEVSVDDANP
ncbi:MAG: hypothetical protein ISN28_06745, partial [Ectothiorhodospiraceae bacterium AqS1]|nr:hypothetical protein [Ectothiorhodospiraceae bacterium AqS1]